MWCALPCRVQVKNGGDVPPLLGPNPENARRGPTAPAEPPVSSTMKMRFRFLSPGLISFTKVSVVMLPEPQHPTRRGKRGRRFNAWSLRPHVHFARPTCHTRRGSGSFKPSNSSKRVETNFPRGFQLQDQNSGGLWIDCFRAGSPPPGMLFQYQAPT